VSSCSVASQSSTVRPGRTTSAATDSGPTGTGPSSSMVIRPTTRSRPVSSRSTARASRAAGGLPCWLVGPHGLPVVGSDETVSRRLLEVPCTT
jgi:hypothetical protein